MRNSAIRKGKIRLLAGIMASLLLSTACLSGVRAAGTEDHMTLHASDGGWKATAEAGETPFPEGAALHIAAGDDTTVAEVRKSIESMDQEESALKSLNVYEISLSDGDGKLLDYDDEITLTVTDEDAVQQDSDDEISCVVYPITEDRESETGMSAGEPVTADSVKLSDAGELAEFTVKTSLTGKIAAAVYTVSDDETEGQKDAIDTLVLDDGETGGNENTDIGISTFAVNPGEEIILPSLQPINKDSYSPLNNLQIVDNIKGAKVEVIEKNDDGVNNICTISDDQANWLSPNNSMFAGEFYGISWSEAGIDEYMYESMRGGDNDRKFGGVSVQFNSSVEGYESEYRVDYREGYFYDKETDQLIPNNDNPYNIYNNPPDDYRKNYEAGWKEDDLDLKKTTMKVILRYTNAGYYKGELIDAEAEIRITPSKNKNQTSNEEQLEVGGYCGIYYPMFQASGSLYRGWVWQNVEQFHVDLTFYEKGSNTPIELGSTNASSAGPAGEDVSQSNKAMNADYYVINSLNPASVTSEDGKPKVYVGPEYVLPTHDIANAYKVGEYTGSDGDTYSSNIQEQYDDSGQAIQHAYNGGTNEWNSDNGNEPGWAQNSVMIMPKARTTTLGFTMGNMSRKPPSTEIAATQATNLMWASISTTPYTKEYQPINIDVEKTWQGITDLTDIKSIDLKLYGEYSDGENKTVKLDLDRQITITPDQDGNWKGTFNFVPGKDFLTQNNYDNDFRYVVRETEITYTNGNSENPEVAGFKLGGTTAIWLKSLPDDASGTIEQKFKLTNIMPGLTIIKKGIDSDGSESPLGGVEFQLQKVDDYWQPVTGETPQSKSTGTDGRLVFSNLKEGNYLLTETKTLSGYTLLKEPVKITIPYKVEASPDTGISYVASDDIVGVTEGNQTKYYNLTYTITNGQSFDMPQTGGTTTGRFMRCGAVLSVTAAGVLLCQRAGRRRWREKS